MTDPATQPHIPDEAIRAYGATYDRVWLAASPVDQADLAPLEAKAIRAGLAAAYPILAARNEPPRVLMTPEELTPGARVMVCTGAISGMVNDHPAVVALAEVLGPASEEDAAVMVDPDMWWLNVHMGPGVTLPHMYRRGEILGVPAHGLTMAGEESP